MRNWKGPHIISIRKAMALLHQTQLCSQEQKIAVGCVDDMSSRDLQKRTSWMRRAASKAAARAACLCLWFLRTCTSACKVASKKSGATAAVLGWVSSVQVSGGLGGCTSC